MDTRIPRIWEKIEQARKMYPQLEKEFGVKKHKFQMNPPLTLSELETFETTHSIKLPQDYADFLTHIGNGGAGPYYGILPLSHWYKAGNKDSSLNTPSIFVPELCKEEVWEQYLSGLGDFDKIWNKLYDGTITICDQGCTYYAILIVLGEQRGRVYNIDTDGHAPYLVKDQDFLSWYERWLDGTLAAEKFFWYGFD